MSYQYLEMGIAAARSGSMEEAGRLLRLAIKSPEINNQMKAVAYMWLAETVRDPAEKRAIYQQAVDADPANTDIRSRVDAFLAAQFEAPPPPASIPETQRPQPAAPPPPPSIPESPRPAPSTTPSGYAASTVETPAMPNTINAPQQPAQILAPQTGTVLDYIVTVSGGPNGNGTGFFPTHHPVIATTRYVVGGQDTVTVEFSPGRGTSGTVIRTYSDYDLALIRIDYAPPSALPTSPMPHVPDEAALTAVSYGGQMTTGMQRPTRRVMAAYWIPTDFSALPDAGGSPLFDQNNYLVGMMTRNTSRSADHFFGLNINLIRQCVETALHDLGAERTAYCHECGARSKAGGIGYFYCEVCGSTLPAAQGVTRYPIPQAEMFYALPNAPRCNHCGAAVGYHGSKCLRCGQPAS